MQEKKSLHIKQTFSDGDRLSKFDFGLQICKSKCKRSIKIIKNS